MFIEEFQKYKHWKQCKKVNYSKLFGYISEMRKLQAQLQCGKVFPSSYLATYSRQRDRDYILVIDLVKNRDSVYANRPFIYAQIICGLSQVLLRIKDMNSNGSVDIVYNDEDVYGLVRGLLDVFKVHGIGPVKTADIYFGQIMVNYQTTFDDTFELLSEGDVEYLYSKLKRRGFEIVGGILKKSYGDFILNITHRNVYGDYIMSLVNNVDQMNIHWAIRDENISKFLLRINKMYKKWMNDAGQA